MSNDTDKITAEAIANTYLVPTVSYAFQLFTDEEVEAEKG